jgi:hypothetical protein
MEKNRTIKELLQLMLDEQDLFGSGLCNWVDNIFYKSKMSFGEKEILTDYIKNNRPSMFSSIDALKCANTNFYWKMNNIKPRIKWINKHIQKNI